MRQPGWYRGCGTTISPLTNWPIRFCRYWKFAVAPEVRKGDSVRSAISAKVFDQDQSFMLVEISGDVLSFQTVSRTGLTVDSGTIQRRP